MMKPEGASTLIHQGGAVFASTPQGLIRSQDTGRTWVRLRTGIPDDTLNWRLTRSGGSLFAWNGNDRYRSKDGSVSWNALAQPDSTLPRGLVSWNHADMGGTLFAQSAEGLMSSDDGGRNWRRMESRSIGGSILALAAKSGRMPALADRGLFVSRDTGITWDTLRAVVGEDPWTAYAESGSRYVVGSQGGKVCPASFIRCGKEQSAH